MGGRAGSALSPDFIETKVNIRGTTYTIRELSIGEYDELVRKATKTQPNALGEDVETIDNTLLLKLMVLKSVVTPRLNPEALSNLPMRVVLKLNQTVNQLHYGDEPETEAPDESEEESGEGNA